MVLRVALPAALLLVGGESSADSPVDAGSTPAPPAEPADDRSPIRSVDDGLEITVPAGAGVGGGHAFALPPTIRLRVGQTVSIRNGDAIAHVVLGVLVRPGATARRTLDAPGVEVYGVGCAVHAGGTGLTTLIVGTR